MTLDKTQPSGPSIAATPSKSQGRGHFRVRAVDARAVPPDLIEAWAELEQRSLEPNAFLSPHFILPALRYLDPQLDATLLSVETTEGLAGRDPRLVGVLVCHASVGGRTFPVPHLVAYRSRHSFLTGLLLDRDHADDALAALLGYVHSRRPFCYGLKFDAILGDGPTHALLAATCDRLRTGREEWNARTRAVLHPHRDRTGIEATVAAETHTLRRRIRRLNEQGQVRWSLVGPGGAWVAATETFLDLEHRGWKGAEGSSLRSTTAGESFFRAVASGFGGAGRMLFAELAVDDKVIASSSNFASGGSGFAFKIGWEPELATLSPGMQVELHLMKEMISHRTLTAIEYWDSGAEEGSYIDRLWTGRRRVVSMAIGSTWVGRSTLRLLQTARAIRRQWRSREPLALFKPR